jgi:MgtC family protein
MSWAAQIKQRAAQPRRADERLAGGSHAPIILGASPIEGELIVRAVVATALGSVVGLERSFRYKDAGLRTLALVAPGSCAFATAGYAVLSLPGLGQVRPESLRRWFRVSVSSAREPFSSPAASASEGSPLSPRSGLGSSSVLCGRQTGSGNGRRRQKA